MLIMLIQLLVAVSLLYYAVGTTGIVYHSIRNKTATPVLVALGALLIGVSTGAALRLVAFLL